MNIKKMRKENVSKFGLFQVKLINVYLVVVDQVYPNPKTRRVLGHFYKPEATWTRISSNFTNPELPEPEVFRISQTRSYPNPKFKPVGTRRV